MNPILQRGTDIDLVAAILRHPLSKTFIRDEWATVVPYLGWRSNSRLQDRLAIYESKVLFNQRMQKLIKEGCGEIKAAFLARHHLYDDVGLN